MTLKVWATNADRVRRGLLPITGGEAILRETGVGTWTMDVQGSAPIAALVDKGEVSPAELLETADAVVVPVLPSTIDIEASVDFLDTLARHPRVRRGELPVGLVANRLRPWTNASQDVVGLLRRWPYPLVAQLRDSQAYVLLCGLGKSLFDYHSAQIREHQADWQPLLRWLKR